jgi:tetratricopeptide (TPR) repeat protein
MKRAFVLFVLAGLASGCVYYNGMYNANRLARAAEKAEREGRTFEANNLWGQVGVKADTVLARHSGSKYADDARLLRGKSYQRLGDCNSAVTILRELLASSGDSALTEEGALLLGRCYQTLGNVEDASHAFQRLVTSANPEHRKEALYQYGRSLRLGGRYHDALAFLEQTTDSRSAGERAAALAGAGRLDEAITVADSLISAGDTAAPWDSMLLLVGRRDGARASALTDRLVAMPQATPTQRAGWLLTDGERLLQTDQDAGARRLLQSLEQVAEGQTAAHSRLQLLRLRMLRAASVDTLRQIWVDLEDMIQTAGSTGIQLGLYQRNGAFVLESVDSANAGATAPDLRLFLAAEIARDSLAMPRMAAGLLQRIPQEFPESPYAAKALLALAALQQLSADSSHALLAGRYPDSPYYLAVQGMDPPAYRALEDSLYRFATALRRSSRPATPTGRQQAPASGARLPQN